MFEVQLLFGFFQSTLIDRLAKTESDSFEEWNKILIQFIVN